LREQKRLWKLRTADSFPQPLRMDILPGGRLSRAELIEGRIYVNQELSKVANLCDRLAGWLALLERVPEVHDPGAPGLDQAIAVITGHPGLLLGQAEIQRVSEVLAHARDVAPIMVGRVLDAVLAQLIWYRIRTYHTEEELQAALAAERAGDLVPDTTPVLLPSAFAVAFRKRLFAVVYDRLARNIEDPATVPEAAAEVFVDFLVHSRPDDNSGAYGGPADQELLRSLCDRTSSRVTGQQARVFELGEAEPDPLRMKKAKRAGLYDAVLKEVGDRLARMSGT
jgi:hypothetical protein